MFSFFGGRARPTPRGPFRSRLRCFSVGCKAREDLECGDKILLPPSALETLVQLEIAYPMMFRLTNPESGLSLACGVLEFVAEEGHCYIPYWMMAHLALDEGGVLEVLNVDLPKGTFVQFKPHSHTFNELSNPRAVLERGLRGYACLNKGSTISIMHVNRTFQLDVVALQPEDAVQIIETDMSVDFAEAKDYARHKARIDAEKEARAAALAAAEAASRPTTFAESTPSAQPMFDFAAPQQAQPSALQALAARNGSAAGAGAGTPMGANGGVSGSATPAFGSPQPSGGLVGSSSGGNDYFARLGKGYVLKSGAAIGGNGHASGTSSGESSGVGSPWALGTPSAGSAGAQRLTSPPPAAGVSSPPMTTSSALPKTGGYTLGTGRAVPTSSLVSGAGSPAAGPAAGGGNLLGGGPETPGGLTRQVLGQWVFYRDANGRLVRREPLSQASQSKLSSTSGGHRLS